MVTSLLLRDMGRVTALVAIIASPGLGADEGRWSNLGPDGGVVFDLEIDPANPTTMYAVVADGVYKSTDAGAAWTRASEGLNPSYDWNTPKLTLDPEQPGTVYLNANGDELYRSSDSAATWTLIKNGAPDIVRVVDVPGQSGVLLAVCVPAADGKSLLRSTDAGASFQPVGGGLPNARRIRSLAFDPGNTQHLLVGVESDLLSPPPVVTGSAFESFDAGDTFVPSHHNQADDPSNNNIVDSITFLGGGKVLARFGDLFAINTANGAAGAWRFTDLGAVGQFDPHDDENTIVHPQNSSVVYYTDPSSQRVVRMTIGDTNQSPVPVSSVEVSDGLSANPTVLSSFDGKPRSPRISRLLAEPGFPAVGTRLYVSSHGAGVMGTLNGGDGQTTGFSFWSSANLNHDLHGSSVRPVLMHPQQPGRIYGGFSHRDAQDSTPGIYASSTAGANWGTLSNGLALSKVQHIVIDLTTTGSPGSLRMYAVGANMFATGFSSTGLFRSNNGGSAWTAINGDIPTIAAFDWGFGAGFSHLALDPRSCASPPVNGTPCVTGPLNRLYASGPGRCQLTAPGQFDCSDRLLRSDDAGLAYQSLDGNPGFAFSRFGDSPYLDQRAWPTAALLDPNNSQTIYAPLRHSLYDANLEDALSADMPTGMMYSADGGATWSARNNGLPKALAGYVGNEFVYYDIATASLHASTIHPTQSGVLWTAANSVDGHVRVYRTNDGGQAWQAAAQSVGLSQVEAIVVDSEDPDVLYATGLPYTGLPAAVLKSEDGGINWYSISVGLPITDVYSLAIDPFNPARLYAGSNSGIWSLTQVPDEDGDGAPDATEINAPNGGDGNNDSVPDGVQRDVGSTVIIFRRSESAKGLGGFFTSDIETALSTPTLEGGCVQARDVQARFALEYGRDYAIAFSNKFYEYPRDLVQFEVVDCSRAIVDVTFHGADFVNEYGWSFRFYGPDYPGFGQNGWHDFSSRAARTSATRWRLTLDANQFGSYRQGNDRILFVGGPACYDDRLFRNGMETLPDNGPPSCNH